jgi:hypothetical protein
MRVNVYAEEMTDRVEIIAKEIDGHKFTGLRLYLYMPTTLPDGTQAKGPFIHRPGDDDSSAITFWGKRDLRQVLRTMLAKLDAHYDNVAPEPGHINEGTALRVWTDGDDYYAAYSATEAASLRREAIGKDSDDMDPFRLAADPLTFKIDEPNVHTETRPQAEWIAIIAENKPGYIGSIND